MIDEAELRESVEQALTHGDLTLGRELIARLWRTRPGPTLSGFVISRYEQLRTPLHVRGRIFLLRSCTYEPVVPVLRAQAFVNGLDLNVQVGDFNSYAQEILIPDSALYRFDPAVCILAVHTADIAPELWDGFADLAPEAEAAVVERVVAEFRSHVRTFRERTQASLVIHSLELPAFPAYGIFDPQSGRGQIDAIQRINSKLREIAQEHKGVYILDYDSVVARDGRENWYDRKWLTMRVPLKAERMSALANEWLRFLHPLLGKISKALVVDLDNTLWGGVIGEDGIKGIKLGKDQPGAAFLALQRTILDLSRRGIILAICSKNNWADAMEVLEHHPEMLLRPSDFAVLKINWDDKAQNIRLIAKELNIGLDAVAFLDDNPAERSLVRAQLPEVTVLDFPENPQLYARVLRDNPLFERFTLSAEDRARGRYYTEERQRAELQSEAGSLENFYRSLEIRITIAQVVSETLARVSQLTQKTNQFNLTTLRYSEPQIAELAADARCRVYTINTADRFGDNGLVGVAIVKFEGETCELDSFLLSCRVIGRTIETALLAAIAAEARANGAKRILGKFVPTKKNAPSRDFLPNHGFRCIEEEEHGSRWELDLQQHLPICPPWIECDVRENRAP